MNILLKNYFTNSSVSQLKQIANYILECFATKTANYIFECFATQTNSEFNLWGLKS